MVVIFKLFELFLARNLAIHASQLDVVEQCPTKGKSVISTAMSLDGFLIWLQDVGLLLARWRQVLQIWTQVEDQRLHVHEDLTVLHDQTEEELIEFLLAELEFAESDQLVTQEKLAQDCTFTTVECVD